MERRKAQRPQEKGAEADLLKEQPKLLRVAQGREISPEMANRLQAQVGNQVLAQLLGRPGNQGVEANAVDDQQEEEEEQEQETEVDEEASSRDQGESGRALPGAARGLPGGGGAGMGQDLQYGGDDDDPFPWGDTGSPEIMLFFKPGRGNLARLESLKNAGRIPPSSIEEANAPFRAEHLEQAEKEVSRWGDARFESPVEAWTDARLLAGRSVQVEDFIQHAGPLDPLFRPILCAKLIAAWSKDPLARAISLLLLEGSGFLIPLEGGACGAASRLATLAVLALAAEGTTQGKARDHALSIGLDEASIDLATEAARDARNAIPPAHVLFGRSLPSVPPMEEPSPASNPPHPWLLRALRRVGQMHAIAEIATFEPMVPAPHLEEGSLESIIDDALGEGRAADDGTAVEARVRALSENAQRLLASLGRFQMEFAAAALASRRMAPTSELAWILKRIFLACRTIAERLIAALQAIDGMRTEAMEPFNSIGREMNASLRALRNDVRTVRARGLSLLAATLRLPETRDLLPPLPRPPIRASCRILWLEAESMREGGRMGEALRLLEEALDVALDEDDLAVAAEGALLLTVQHLREGRVVEALLPLERAIDLAIASTHTLVEAVGRSLRMSLDLAAHRWDAVETDAQAQRQCAARRNNLPAMVDASLNLCAVHLARERPTEAVSGLIEAGQHVLISGDARLLVPLKARMAEIREDLGREAFEDLIRRVKSLHEG